MVPGAAQSWRNSIPKRWFGRFPAIHTACLEKPNLLNGHNHSISFIFLCITYFVLRSQFSGLVTVKVTPQWIASPIP